MERASDELEHLKGVKDEYDDLWYLMAEEFEILAATRPHVVTREDIERWTEFNRRIKALKERAML